MSLTTRLNAFFLAALALVLAGFSVALYLLAQNYLTKETDDKLKAALDTLATAVDVDDMLEWEGHERHLTLGRDDSPDQVRWTVHGNADRLVSKSENLNDPDLGETGTPTLHTDAVTVDRPDGRWRLRQIELRGHGSRWGGGFIVHSGKNPTHGLDFGPNRHFTMVLTVAVPLQPQEDTLRNLALALAGLSAGVLLMAGLAGRWLCRRALAPVTAMAGAARAMTAADRDARLPPTGTADELADLGRAFNDLLSRLQEAFERQRRFTGDASHQLRTPLAAVLGQVEVALRRDRTAEEYRAALVRVQGQAQHLRHIVDMLLFLARAEAEARAPELVDTDLAAWLPEHLLRWADHPRRPDIRVEAEPCRACVQPALLGQLLDNLLDNACKYSDAGTAVVIRLGRDGAAVALAVEDAGCGIAAEDVPHLFEPFFRSAEARRQGKAGVGLGLAVARRIAAALGGTLQQESSAGVGCRFVLRLPAV
jgi:heavy metal sensor kinase